VKHVLQVEEIYLNDMNYFIANSEKWVIWVQQTLPLAIAYYKFTLRKCGQLCGSWAIISP